MTEEYIPIKEVARRLSWSADTIESKMRQGIFVQGKHFFRRKGITVRFKWSAVVKWIEGEEKEGSREVEGNQDVIKIPISRGRFMLGRKTT